MTKLLGLWLNIWLLWLLSLPCFSLQLFDGESFLYDIGKNGGLTKGTLDAYASMYHLRVNGASYVGNIRTLSADGREVRREVFVEPATGLEVRRHLYVSKTQNLARFSEILYNPTETDVKVEVEIHGKLGAGSHTVAVADQGHFLITDDVTDGVSGSLPVLLHYHSQINNPITATHTLSGNQLSWVYSNVTIAAQSQVRFIYFVAQTTNIATAHRVATQVYSNVMTLYESMEPIASGELLNFTPPKPTPRDDDDGDFSTAPFLNLDEVRTGALEENDSWSRMRVATPADVYALTLAKNETVTIRLSATFNAYIYLFQDTNGTELVASNDDRGVNTTHAEIVFTATEAGTYYLEATAHNRRERGPYVLEILTGAINQSPHAYPFEWTSEQTLIAPATVTFTDFSHDVDGEIEERCWQFGDGTPISCNAGNTVTHTYQQAGHYSVGLTLRDNQGAYAYHNEAISIGSTSSGIVLRVSNTVAGELASSDVRSQTRSSAFADRYRMTSVTAGQELVIDMISDDFDSYLYLYDQFNRLLHQDDNSGGGAHARLRYTPMLSSDLLVEATCAKDNTVGQYNLTLDLADNSATIPVPIEVSTTLNNPLQRLFLARLPAQFQATLLRWNFGDGSQEARTDKAIVSHTYPSVGSFTITMTALNAGGQQVTGSLNFNLDNPIIAPEVRFQASPLFGEAPLRVFFRNESTSNLPDNHLNYVWQFGDGTVSTDISPAHTFTQAGTYHVTLQASSNLTHQRASYSLPITVIDRNSAEIPVTGTVRQLPQVLLAGFEPMLVDLLDTDVKIFAIVRLGKTPLQTVRFIPTGSDFGWAMQHVATYPNGDQRYEMVFTFPQGQFAVCTLSNLFGEQPGQFQIQATDQAGQFHAFPNLEIGNYPPMDFIPKALNIEPLHQVSIRRHQPQVLAAGFDPALIHKNTIEPSLATSTDAEFMVKAIVREGLAPIQSVTLEDNQSIVSLPMHLQEILPNGDKLYAVNYTYPSGSLEKGTLGNLFGDKPGQFTVKVVDKTLQTHRFPELKIGNFLQQ